MVFFVLILIAMTTIGAIEITAAIWRALVDGACQVIAEFNKRRERAEAPDDGTPKRSEKDKGN